MIVNDQANGNPNSNMSYTKHKTSSMYPISSVLPDIWWAWGIKRSNQKTDIQHILRMQINHQNGRKVCEDATGVIEICNSNNRQYNYQTKKDKMTNNDLHNLENGTRMFSYYPHMVGTCMTSSFHYEKRFGSIKLF